MQEKGGNLESGKRPGGGKGGGGREKQVGMFWGVEFLSEGRSERICPNNWGGGKGKGKMRPKARKTAKKRGGGLHFPRGNLQETAENLKKAGYATKLGLQTQGAKFSKTENLAKKGETRLSEGNLQKKNPKLGKRTSNEDRRSTEEELIREKNSSRPKVNIPRRSGTSRVVPLPVGGIGTLAFCGEGKVPLMGRKKSL